MCPIKLNYQFVVTECRKNENPRKLAERNAFIFHNKKPNAEWYKSVQGVLADHYNLRCW
jgi:hypothetical protein